MFGADRTFERSVSIVITLVQAKKGLNSTLRTYSFLG